MGKNQKGGKKHKKYKNSNVSNIPRQTIHKDDGQNYFIITKMLGDGRCLGNGDDGRTDVLLIIRGSMRKKVWIHSGDYVLGSYRDFSAKPVADILHKYQPDEINSLRKSGMFNFGKNSDEINKEEEMDESGFTFEDL